MRNKYIRFFVSSTFADMKKERNLLQEVIDKLSIEYSLKGWQIEAVDLRWGISEEAGLENKTMQICKTELERCQELSPKPNFIVLLGNRYGWIPLPETVAPKDVRLIMFNPSVKKTSKELFYQWYKLDENALPDGKYVLQGRTGEYVDQRIWEEKVEAPLSELFSIVVDGSQIIQNSFVRKLFPKKTHWIPRSLYGLSATELEIQKGALSVNDAHEHVLAYFRNIININTLPDELREVYKETGYDANEKSQKLLSLKQRLKDKLSDTNTIDRSVLWNEYETEQFSTLLKDDFELHLRRIIDRTIDGNSSENMEDSENQKHKEIAVDKSRNFVGRLKELEYIDSYINDPDQRDVLLISGPSGSGKSALMGQVVENYSESHHIICRFCSTTPDSSNENKLLTSIQDDICSLYEVQERQLPNLFHYITVHKPLLIIVDAINEIGAEKEFITKFTPFQKDERGKIVALPLAKNIKIIITSTVSYDYKKSKFKIYHYTLNNMGTDSLNLIQKLLSSNERRLTSTQYKTLNSVIETSDKSALYLHILGHYLVDTPSWKDVSSTPNTLDDLLKVIVDNISLPERHGNTAKEVLSLLTIERSGLTDKEVSKLLAFDDDFYNEFKDKSFQKWDDHNERFIPPVVWLRLKYSLKYFIKERFTDYGKTISFFHSGIEQSIYKYLFGSDKTKTLHFYLLLYRYYKCRIQFDDIHAYEELLHCGNETVRLSYDKVWNGELCKELEYFLEKDTGFIGNILKLASTNLLLDMEDSLCCLRMPLKEVSTLREIISDDVSGLDLKASIKRLPSWNIYRKIFEALDESKCYMEDSLSDSYSASTIYTIDEIGESPCMDDKGTKIASILNNGHKVKINNFISPKDSIIFTHINKMLEIQSDGTMRYFAIRFEDSCMIYDSVESKVVVSYKLLSNDWFYLSKNGRYLIIGSDNTIELIDLWNNFESATTEGLSCKCSSSGKHIWVISTEGTLCRFDTLTLEEGITFPVRLKNDKNEEYNPFLSKNCIIHTCSDNICVCQEGYNSIIISHYDNEKEHRHQFQTTVSKDYEIGLAIVSDDEKKVVVVNENTCNVYVKDKDNSLKYTTATYIEDISIINYDLSKALVGNRIVDFNLSLQQFVIGKGGNSGLNGMSIDYNGNQIFVASGINANFDWQIDCGRVSFGKKYKWTPPFKNPQYQYLAGVAVSPNGENLVASAMGENQITFYSLKENRLLNSFFINDRNIQDKDIYYGACIGIAFSNDSKYSLAMTGHHIIDGKYRLYILNTDGNVIQQYDEMDYPWGNNGTMGFSANNRYVYSGDYNCMIKDIVDQFDVTKEDDMRCTDVQIEKTNIPCKFFSIIVDITPLNLLLTQREGKLYSMNYMTGKVVTEDCNMILLATSSTGRYLYFKNGGRLYMKQYQSEEYILIYNDVQRLIPAFDEDHIFIIMDDALVVLFNIKKKEVEQTARANWPILFHKVCAKGLAVVTTLGYTLLFSPDKCFNVNKPAVTNFVRRWNIETKQQEAPTAICPMCGGLIEITSEIQNILIDNPAERKFDDWDNPKLFGHSCPHCKAELRYNPYIV